MSKAQYYVLDGDGNTVWKGREVDDGPDSFTNFAAAEKRARKLAEITPNEEYRIAKVEAIVVAPATSPVTRLIGGARQPGG